jgi:hypothetical protein
LQLICCILDPFLRLGRWPRGCELVDTVLQEYPHLVPARQGLRLSLLEESCKLHGHLVQSPSGGLWHVGGFDEVRCVSNGAEELLELVVLH